MPRKNRQTTSVSTLIANVNNCVAVAAVGNRRDLLKVLIPLKKRVQALAKEYVEIRAEFDPIQLAMSRLNPSLISEIEAEIELEKELEGETAE